MQKRVEVRSQAEFDAAIKAAHWAVVLGCRIEVSSDLEFEAGDGARVVARDRSAPRVVAWDSAPRVVARDRSAPRVEARGSSAPRVEAWDTSAPRVEARGSSAPRVVAWDSSAPRVEARGSSAPRVEARDTSAPHVVAWDSSAPRVEAWDRSVLHVEAWDSSAPRVVARDRSAPRVVAWGSSAPRVVAWDSSAPRVVARGSSAPRVEAWDSSAPRVEARDSSAPHVVAWDRSAPRVVAMDRSAPRVVARGSSAPRVEAWGYVQISLSGFGGQVIAKLGRAVAALIQGSVQAEGGQQTLVTAPTSVEAWCEHHGVAVTDGVATLYKGVGGDFRSDRGGDYTPGTVPVAPDWDGGDRECGGGLHLSPRPAMTREFCNPDRFVVCPVALVDMRAPAEGDAYPSKIKVRGCCAPVWECDEDGEPVAQPVETA